MDYILKNKEQILLTFTLEPDGSITEKGWEEKAAKPLALEHHGDLKAWLTHRMAPAARQNMDKLMGAAGIASFQDYLDKTCCLSLNDSFWVVPKGDRRQYQDLSPYRGNLDPKAAQLALWGESDLDGAPGLSPEYTTGGSRAKAWEVGENNRLQLVKRASSPETREPYSDYYSVQLLKALGVERYAHYDLTERGGQVCSVSRMFTDELLGFLPARELQLGNDLGKLEEHYRKYHQFRFLRKMFLFDALVLNPSRRAEKFGYQTVNGSRGIIWGAPVFGNGDALLSKAPADIFSSKEKMWDYAGSLTPAMGEDFVKTARYFSSEWDLELLEQLSENFSFCPHPQYNLPAHMLDALSDLVRTQAKRIVQA